MSNKNRIERHFIKEPERNGGQEELALHLLHSMDQPICVLDAGDQFLFANKAYANLYGVGLETLRGKTLGELIGESLYESRMRVLLGRARSEGSAEFRGWVEYPGSGRRFMESEIRLYDFPGYLDKECVMIQSRDITEQEEMDRSRRKSLHFQEELLGHVPAMIWVSGKDGIPYFFNDSWLNFTGMTLVEQVREGWLNRVHPEDRAMVQERVLYAIRNEEELHLDFRLHYLMGGYRWVRLYGLHAEGLSGPSGDFVVSALDIDDSKGREIQMKAALAEERHLREQAMLQKTAADRANREKSAYLSLASHEIRTPMNPIIGFADLLASNSDLDADSKEMAQMILKAGKNLLTLLDEVLDYAKIEAGVLKLSPEPMDIHDLLSELESLYAFDAKSRGVELRLSDRVKGDGEVYQDRLRLQQVLGTLITNAIKMTHTGYVELEAETRETGTNRSHFQMLKFTIRDTGVGMDQQALERLFQPFARPDSEFSDKYAGTGLGLAIAQKLVDSMQGKIEVKSRPGKGTTVELQIPFEPVPDHLRRSPAEEEIHEEKKKRAGIIIVDDEESSRMVNASLMRFLGFPCDVVTNGEELMEQLEDHTYSMILIDIMMPGLDGLEATRRIRNGDCGEGNREAYIVAVTACAMEEDRERGLRSGINAYLTKPLTIEALRETINDYHSLGRSI